MDNDSEYKFLLVLRFGPDDFVVDPRLLHRSDQTGTGGVLHEADSYRSCCMAQ